MSNCFILDSWALMALLQHEEPAVTRVREVVKEANLQQARLLISIINVGEVYYRAGRLRGKKAADHVLLRISQLPLTIVSADDDTVVAAAAIKMVYSIAYADAFAAEVARRWEGVLLTGDPEFAKVQDFVRIEWLHRGQ